MLLWLRASLVAAGIAALSGDPEQCGDGNTCQRGGLSLYQHRSQHLKHGSGDFEQHLRTAWVASAFGDCTIAGDGSAMKTRTVECIDVRNKQEMPGACQFEKPCASKPCTCPGLEPCVDGSASTTLPECKAEEAIGLLDAVHYEEIGCIASTAKVKGSDNFAYECMSATGSSPCHDGLPFFANADVVSVDTCFKFCTSKGLDLFGVLSGQECRCGASVVNEAAWHEERPRAALLFPWNALSHCTGAEALKVYRYTGHFEASGLPASLLDIHEDELTYLDSVVTGKLRIEEAAEDGYSAQDIPSKYSSALQVDSGFLPRCSGGQNCGPGTPWRTRKSSPPANMPDKWQEYVEVPFFFSNNLDNIRKEAFREAVRRIMSKTCIVLKEVKSTARPNSQVGLFDSGSCYVSGLGYPGSSGLRRVNLGWCNSMRYVGNMVHEIGHLIGMNHEQKRPDAGMAYHGHGPYLKLFWQNIPNGWAPQYRPDMRSYVGSANDGPGDPHVGYADYDFASIMHYPVIGNRFDTIPASKESLAGNRKALTAGDVDQILDMYQCKLQGSGPRPTPRPRPRPRPTPRPTPRPRPRPRPTPRPTPVPKPTPGSTPVLNRGQDCWGKCKGKSGLCSWCGKGNLCCRRGWTRDPQICKAVPPSQYITSHHECVQGPPSPVPTPPRPTPTPATPTPGPKPPCRDTDARCATKWKGKCSKKMVQKKCAQSCDMCGKCIDTGKKCPKLKSKCLKNKKVRARCPLTCGVCSNSGSR